MLETIQRTVRGAREQLAYTGKVWEMSLDDLEKIVLHDSDVEYAEELTQEQSDIVAAEKIIYIAGSDEYVQEMKGRMDAQALVDSKTVVVKAPWFTTTAESQARIMYDDTWRGRVGVARRTTGKAKVGVWHTDVSKAYRTNPLATPAYLAKKGLGYDVFMPYGQYNGALRTYRLAYDHQYTFNAGYSAWYHPTEKKWYGGPKSSVNPYSYGFCFGHPNTPMPISQFQYDQAVKEARRAYHLHGLPLDERFHIRHADTALPKGRKQDFHPLSVTIGNIMYGARLLEGLERPEIWRMVVVDVANVRQSPRVPDLKKGERDNRAFYIDQKTGRLVYITKKKGDVFRSDAVLKDEKGEFRGGTDEYDHDASGVGFVHRSTTKDAGTVAERQAPRVAVAAVTWVAGAGRRIMDMEKNR